MTRIKPFISFLFVLFLAAPVAAEQRVMVFSSLDSKVAEAAMHILQVAYGKLDIEIDRKVLPLTRAHLDAEMGVVDGEVLRMKDEGPPPHGLIRIDVPLFVSQVVAYTCGETNEITDWHSLENYHIGIRKGIEFLEKNTAQFPRVTKQMTPGQLFDLLDAGRIDVVIANPLEGAKYLAMNKNTCIFAATPVLIEFPLYHYLNTKHRDIAPAIELILKDMAESGQINQIRKKYLSKK